MDLLARLILPERANVSWCSRLVSESGALALSKSLGPACACLPAPISQDFCILC